MYDLYNDLKIKLKHSFFDRKLTNYEIEYIHDLYLEYIHDGLDSKHAFNKAINIFKHFQFKNK